MEKPILKIKYDAFAQDHIVEDFLEIENFKKDLSQNYSHFIKPTPVGRGGGAYELAIEFLLNTDIKTYLGIVGGYLAKKIAGKVVDPVLEQYLFLPFRETFLDYKNNDKIGDIYEFAIEFFDCKLIIYKLEEDSVLDKLDEILKTIYDTFESILIDNEFPYLIVVPLISDFIQEEPIYRMPLGLEESIENINKDYYFKLWGIEYHLGGGRKIFDVQNRLFIDGVFYTEDEYFKKLLDLWEKP